MTEKFGFKMDLNKLNEQKKSNLKKLRSLMNLSALKRWKKVNAILTKAWTKAKTKSARSARKPRMIVSVQKKNLDGKIDPDTIKKQAYNNDQFTNERWVAAAAEKGELEAPATRKTKSLKNTKFGTIEVSKMDLNKLLK